MSTSVTRSIPILILMLPSLLAAQPASGMPPSEVRRSHIDENVPPRDQFHSILDRDLREFFQARHGGARVEVRYALLRDGPTQSGVSFPKYYAWIVATTSTGKREEGAARLAAIDRQRFVVDAFVSAARVNREPLAVETDFPAALVPAIRERASQARLP